MKGSKCKTCGHMSGQVQDGNAWMQDGNDDYKMNDDDDMKLGLLDELQDTMGQGMDGNIKIIISSRGKPRKGYNV